ncbi:MAG: tetratricopeptide repeat protein [Betaproteobacteria bacterium]|nr:tetratricopeptide repeat protein [Betaproteobacteria bacterium]
MTPAERWEAIVANPDEDIDLAEAALVIAAEEYRGLDIDAYLARIDDMAAVLQRRLRSDIPAAEAILALNRYVFDELGFSGNGADYYDARNSFLNEVIERRLGIPITLSLVYTELGRRLGLALHGVSFPGHFLVKCAVRGGTVVLDPFSRGLSLSVDDLRERLCRLYGGTAPEPEAIAHMLGAATKKEILARMLRNLKGIYVQQRDFNRALGAAQRIVALGPVAAEEYRDRAAIYVELECFRAALEDYRQYLVLRPEAADAGSVRARIGELQPLAARLN